MVDQRVLAVWWGYATGNRTVVAAVVVAVAMAALGFVTRAWGGRR